MAQSVVDGRGMSAVAMAKDYDMWLYDPPSAGADAPPVIETGRRKADHGLLEKIVTDASAALGSHMIAKIQNLEVLLSEDAGMKVNKASEKKARLFFIRFVCFRDKSLQQRERNRAHTFCVPTRFSRVSGYS